MSKSLSSNINSDVNHNVTRWAAMPDQSKQTGNHLNVCMPNSNKFPLLTYRKIITNTVALNKQTESKTTVEEEEDNRQGKKVRKRHFHPEIKRDSYIQRITHSHYRNDCMCKYTQSKPFPNNQ